MTKNNLIIRFFILATITFFLSYCATPFPPSGGEKDTTPPGLVDDKTTPNKQVNFKKQDIVLTFDEWINLKNIFEQVVVSPPLEYPFELKIKGKSVFLKFDEKEVLRDNATYTINFGDAIQDLTENNPAKDLRFVFATGAYIDSLAIAGSLIDAITHSPIENALFMLYENTSDSVVYKDRPFYFAKSDKNGSFKIENIKSGTFKAVALKDEDLNYLYNKGEAIGFLDTLFTLTGNPTMPMDTSGAKQDSSQLFQPKIPQFNIALFKEDIPLALRDVDSSRYGFLNLIFNQAPLFVATSPLGWQDTIYKERDKDSLKIWYPPQEEGKDWMLIVSRDSVLQDTIPVPMSTQSSYLQSGRLIPLTDDSPKNIPPKSNVIIPFNNPLKTIDTSKVMLLEDSIRKSVTPTFFFDTIVGRKLNTQYKWKEEIPYELLILPGAVTDVFEHSNKDSILLKILPASSKLFGNLSLTINDLDSSKWYICELFYKETNLITRWSIHNQKEYKQSWTALKPGSYQIVIKRDDNKNGRWDSGSYDNHRQIEPVFKKSLEQLRQNWDLEAEVSPVF